MLCQVCWRMLRGQVGKQWKGTYDLHYKHHDSTTALKTSYDTGCGICLVLYEEVIASVKKDLGIDPEDNDCPASGKPATGSIDTIVSAHSTALLTVIEEIEDDDVFRLDFTLEWVMGDKPTTIVKRTFILKQIAASPVAPFPTPVSGETSSTEVFQLAMSWIRHCDQSCKPKCAKPHHSWYPTRLIDIRGLKPKVCLNPSRDDPTSSLSKKTQNTQDTSNAVRLVERPRDDPYHGAYVFGETCNNLYTTLSHCWGESQHYTLTPDKATELRNGIELNRLPKTFRDAIAFAAEIPNVGWIWIDSLCIYQGKCPESEKDWLHEAALMQRVYKESYLNISATAASNSSVGLYWERDCSALWENEVSVNIDGIPGLTSRATNHQEHGDTTTVFEYVWEWLVDFLHPYIGHRIEDVEAGVNLDSSYEKPLPLGLPERHGLRRCIIIDTSYWDRLVNRAPVNTRAWVLQERLLAPRVLHFCKGSIAWECAGFTRIEGHDTDVPRFNLHRDRISQEVSFKGLNPFHDGKKLRHARLGNHGEPDPHIPERHLYGFELWARVVEMYSRLNLKVETDKLMAMSGIAQMMATEAFGSERAPARYVAGLWHEYLESQLLWRVEPIFMKHDRTFQHSGKRSSVYRAPSFSWASIDAQRAPDDQPGAGIIYGEVTDQDLLIEVRRGADDIVVNHKTENEFGIVTGGQIMVSGKLRRIILSRGERGTFYWRLLDRADVFPRIEKERHHNVYLDAPDDDHRLQAIFESDDIYCLPAARGPRTEGEESKYIICLILQQAPNNEQVKHLNSLEQKGTFRRIGLTKLGRSDRHTYKHILDNHDTDSQLPCWPGGFNKVTNQQLIRII